MSAISAYSKNFENVLQSVHNQMREKMAKQTLKENAKKLQEILSTIKIEVNRLRTDKDFAVSELGRQYEEFFNEIATFQNAGRKGVGGNLSGKTLFRRGSRTKTSVEADNIFEDDLDALFSYIANQNRGYHLVGGQGATTMSLVDIATETEKNIIDTINKAAEKAQSKYRAKQLKAELSQKVDVTGFPKEVTISLRSNLLDNIDFQTLAELLKDATFTAKQYTSYRKGSDAADFSAIGLKLGQTNPYKSITGALSSIYASVKDQNKIFFRGLSTVTYSDRSHSASPESVELHFTHLRFIYELRGEGLFDKSGNSAIAKYIIYNDPNSDAIFVRDTASIILEELDSKVAHRNLFGVLHLAASRVNSNK